MLSPGDFAIFGAGHGVPYGGETGLNYEVATGSAPAPEAIRRAANQTSNNIDHYDFDLGGPLMAEGRLRLCDMGDLVLAPADGTGNATAIHAFTAQLLARGAVPVLLGGDDSVPLPWLAAFAAGGPVKILQLDAHIDWRDEIGGERMGYSSTMRRASEHPFVTSITQVGMRGIGSARMGEVHAAQDWGARLVTVAEARRLTATGVVDLLPSEGRLVIQVDLDVFDPSVCGAVNAPTPGGFRFEEVTEIVRLAIARHGLAGFSVVELVPDRDPFGLSADVAARLICNAIGAACRN